MMTSIETVDYLDFINLFVRKAKVASTHGHTTPYLELCAGVFIIKLTETVEEELDLAKSAFCFYSDR